MTVIDETPRHQHRHGPAGAGDRGGRAARTGPAGVGRPQPRHGAGVDPGRPPDRGPPAPVRRPGPLAADPHRRAGRRPPNGVRRTGGDGVHQHRCRQRRRRGPWVEALRRNVGFAVFAKPKVDEDSDVDSDMLAHIELRRREGLAAVLVASADGQAFRAPLEDIARIGTPVTVLGFREHASWALASDSLEFVDLEDIPGVFRAAAADRIGFTTRARSLAAAVPGRCPRC